MKVWDYSVAKYKISWTESRRQEPKMHIYLLIPILSIKIPEGTLNKAPEK